METTSRNVVLGAIAGMALLLGGCFCAAAPGQTEASLYLSDAGNGAMIKAPTFTEAGETISASCEQPDDQDPSLCTAELLVLDPAVHTIVVSAPGYASQTITVDTSAKDSLHLAVELSRAQ